MPKHTIDSTGGLKPWINLLHEQGKSAIDYDAWLQLYLPPISLSTGSIAKRAGVTWRAARHWEERYKMEQEKIEV